MKSTLYIQLIICICCALTLSAQVDSLDNELNLTPTPSAIIDTFPSITPDSDSNTTPINVPISKDAIEEGFEFGAIEREWAETQNVIVHLKGDAFVKFEDAEIKAGYIIFNLKENEVVAEELVDENGESTGIPEFIHDGATVKYKKLRYNFKTEQGLVYGAVSRQDQFYVHGAVTKFVKENPDSLIFDDAIYNKDALITTCDHDEPHYGIRTTKLKIIPDKLAIIGPARIEIAGLPTPLFIPFALAPLFSTPSGRSGLIFGGTEGFEFSPTLGLGFRGLGYHFAISEYMNLTVTGDIYSRGTWSVNLGSEYNRRYKYNGNVAIGYNRQIIDVEGELNPVASPAFSFRLNHKQDNKAHPYINVGGTLNFTTNDFGRRTQNDADTRFENIINSNFNFSHSLPALPNFSLTVGITHSQNTRTRDINFTLPDVNLRSKTMYPFKKKRGGNKEKWYEKINIRYNSRFRNFVSTKDTILFSRETLDDIQTGMTHEATAGASFNLFKYFNLTPNVSYREFWFVKTLNRTFDPDSIISIDTINVDPVELDTLSGTFVDEFNTGFRRYRDLNTGFNLSTNLFNTARFKKGWLRGLRHTIKPSVGFNFSPNTEQFLELVQVVQDGTGQITSEAYIDPETGETVEFNPFNGGAFSVPRLREKQMSFTYSINNIFEGKYYSKKDSTEKKFKIFDNLRFGGSHNFAADSLRWSQVSASGTARFFDNITTISMRATFDPYIRQNGRRVNITQWSQENRLLRFDNFNTSISTRYTFAKLRELFKGKEDEKDELKGKKLKTKAKKKGFMQESVWDLLEKFSVSHTLDFGITTVNDVDKEFNIRANSIKMQGSFALTDKWDVAIGNFSYDFTRKRFVYPTFGLRRDLHCWEMRFDWQPARGTYTFNIAVRTSELSNFLKYDYGRNNVDSRFF